ncbi:MAG TPA: hypothetical protein VL460_11345 [Caulobacteraceae bacterium]|nr:hypothetical protein [Caulobacteraceae bacterium]
MADLRIPPPSVPAGAQRPGAAQPVRPQAARAAQQAFFQAAAGREPAYHKAAAPTAQPTDAAPQRPMRPGSFVDIKV